MRAVSGLRDQAAKIAGGTAALPATLGQNIVSKVEPGALPAKPPLGFKLANWAFGDGEDSDTAYRHLNEQITKEQAAGDPLSAALPQPRLDTAAEARGAIRETLGPSPESLPPAKTAAEKYLVDLPVSVAGTAAEIGLQRKLLPESIPQTGPVGEAAAWEMQNQASGGAPGAGAAMGGTVGALGKAFPEAPVKAAIGEGAAFGASTYLATGNVQESLVNALLPAAMKTPHLLGWATGRLEGARTPEDRQAAIDDIKAKTAAPQEQQPQRLGISEPPVGDLPQKQLRQSPVAQSPSLDQTPTLPENAESHKPAEVPVSSESFSGQPSQDNSTARPIRETVDQPETITAAAYREPIRVAGDSPQELAGAMPVREPPVAAENRTPTNAGGAVENAPSVREEATVQPESNSQANGDRRRGFVNLPTAQDVAPVLGEVRRIRERFSGIEGRYGSDVAKGFTKTVQSGVEARSVVRAMMKQTGATEDTLTKLRAIGLDNRAIELKSRGLPASTVPTLTPADAAAYRADPKVKAAMKWWNDNVAPDLTDIRSRNGMILSSAPSKMDFFVNLVGELGPESGGGKTGTNLQEAFNKAAAGEGTYKSDPTDFFTSMVQQHLRTDASAQLADAIRAKASVPPGSVIDPQAKLSPAAFPAKPSNRYFTADFKGRKVEVEAINLNPNPSGTPDYHYVPREVAREFNNIRQPVSQHDTILDKAMSAGTAASTFGSIALHAWREISHAGSRIAESGQDLKSAIPWIGSKVAAVKRMVDLRDSKFGDTVQLLVDRTGGDKGVGWGVQPAKTSIGRLLNKPHEMLFNPDTGFDPMMRRVVADAHLRTMLGADAVSKIESDVNAGKLSPIEAARQIENGLKPEEFQGLGRQINNTLGWANKQTRSDLLNSASRVFPYISSESGMIPRELVARVTRGVNPKALAAMARNGQYTQLATSLLGSLATGAIGTHLAMNALNYASTKATTGKGQWMSDNDEGHKTDVQVAPKWYWSNMDPMLSRANRVLGYKQAANDQPYSFGREAVNEGLSTLNNAIRAAFTLGTGRTARLNDQNQLDKSRSGMLDFVNTGRNTAQAISQGKSIGAGMLKDVANLAGVQLQQSTGKNYTHAERMAKYLSYKPGEDLKPDQIQHMRATDDLLNQMRGKPDQAESLLDDAIAKGSQPRDERSNLLYRSQHGDLENAIKYRLGAADAVRIYKDAQTTGAEREKIKDLVRDKIIKSDKSADEQDAMLKDAGIDKPDDLDTNRELTDLRRQRKEASDARVPFTGAPRLRMLERQERLSKGPKQPR